MPQRPAEIAIKERIKTLDGTIGDYNKCIKDHYKLIADLDKKKLDVRAEIDKLEEDLKKFNGTTKD